MNAKDGNLGIDKMNEAKDLALRKAAEIKNQIEEEKKAAGVEGNKAS